MTFNYNEKRMLNAVKSGKLIAFRYGDSFLVVFAEDAGEITKKYALSYDEVKELLLQEKKKEK
jgi:hypothetical protein